MCQRCWRACFHRRTDASRRESRCLRTPSRLQQRQREDYESGCATPAALPDAGRPATTTVPAHSRRPPGHGTAAHRTPIRSSRLDLVREGQLERGRSRNVASQLKQAGATTACQRGVNFVSMVHLRKGPSQSRQPNAMVERSHSNILTSTDARFKQLTDRFTGMSLLRHTDPVHPIEDGGTRRASGRQFVGLRRLGSASVGNLIVHRWLHEPHRSRISSRSADTTRGSREPHSGHLGLIMGASLAALTLGSKQL